MTLLSIIRACLETLFPRWCSLCNCKLSSTEKVVCFVCKSELPYTHFHLKPHNLVEQVMWGRVPIERATALLFYTKGSKIGDILHELKYEGALENGEFLGQMLGNQLKQCNDFSTIDFVVAVPLHRIKEQKRGYNQADVIAQELAKTMGIAHRKDILLKIKNNQTQTKKGRFDRWQNATESYVANSDLHLNHKHIMLVDDVITTGATLEACSQALREKYDVKISIVAGAYAH